MNLQRPAHAIGQVVRVFTYYDDMLVRGSFTAVITGVNTYQIPGSDTAHHIYEVLSSDSPAIQTAEEFAIQLITKE